MNEYTQTADQWSSIVNDLMDSKRRELGLPNHQTEEFCIKILRFMRTAKLRQPNLFKEHRGIEYETFRSSLAKDYDETYIDSILLDDRFWDTTLELARFR